MPSFCAISASVGLRCRVGGQIARGGLHLFVAAAHVARGPIELPQAIEDRALDAVLGVARKRYLFVGIVLAGGVEQAEDAGVHQIVHVHMDGQVLMHANGDGFHQRQMFQHDAVAAGQLGALLRRARLARRSVSRCSVELRSISWNLFSAAPQSRRKRRRRPCGPFGYAARRSSPWASGKQHWARHPCRRRAQARLRGRV